MNEKQETKNAKLDKLLSLLEKIPIEDSNFFADRALWHALTRWKDNLPGNHYAGWHQLFNLRSGNGFYLDNKIITFVPNYIELIINGQPIVASHYPLLSWNGQAKGSWMLFSHVHGNLEKSDIGKMYLDSGAKCYELSVEKNKHPASFSYLFSLFEDKENISFDHHGPHTQNPF